MRSLLIFFLGALAATVWLLQEKKSPHLQKNNEGDNIPRGPLDEARTELKKYLLH